MPASLIAVHDTTVELPFEARVSLAWLDPNRVAVIDVDDKQVVVLGLDGRVSRAGRDGSGPGEYRTPLRLFPSGDGGLLVFDVQARQIQWLGPDLRWRGTTHTPRFPNGIVGLSGDSITMMWQVFPQDSLGREVGAVLPDGTSLPGSWRLGAIDPVFSEAAAPADGQQYPDASLVMMPDGSLVLGEERDYRLWHLSRTGRILATGGRPALPASGTEPYSEAQIQEELDRAKRIARDPEMIQQIEATIRQRHRGPRYRFRTLAVETSGRLWVVADRGTVDSTPVDLFTPALQYSGTLWLEGQVQTIAIDGDRLATLSGEPGEVGWKVRVYTVGQSGDAAQ